MADTEKEIDKVLLGGGGHTWQRREIMKLIAKERREAKIEVLDYIIKKHAAHVTSPRTNCTVVNSIIADLKKTQLQPTKEAHND